MIALHPVRLQKRIWVSGAKGGEGVGSVRSELERGTASFAGCILLMRGG